MGQDKSLLTLSGLPLIQHALTSLRSAGLEPRIAGSSSHLSKFAPVIPDDSSTAGLGPLSGICTGLSAATRRYSVFLPVDLPLMPASLIAYLVRHASITESPVTLISVAGFIQTFPVVLDRAAAPHLLTALRSGHLKCLTGFQSAALALSSPLGPLALELLVQAGQVQHPSGLSPCVWFQNLNTPADLQRIVASAAALFN